MGTANSGSRLGKLLNKSWPEPCKGAGMDRFHPRLPRFGALLAGFSRRTGCGVYASLTSIKVNGMRGGLLFLLALTLASPAMAKPFTPREAGAVAVFDTKPAIVEMAAVDAALEVKLPIAPPVVLRNGPRLQCAVYARERSGVELRGSAGTWWTKAQGQYRRAKAPEQGAVIVLGGTRHGHVAVVTDVLSSREILVDHANWMNKGEVQLGALMIDVSANNDWTRVRVWYPPTKGLGTKAYPVKGFILPGVTVQLASLP